MSGKVQDVILAAVQRFGELLPRRLFLGEHVHLDAEAKMVALQTFQLGQRSLRGRQVQRWIRHREDAHHGVFLLGIATGLGEDPGRHQPAKRRSPGEWNL